MGTRARDQDIKRNQIKPPDVYRHFQLSMIKSAIRIAAGITLAWPQNFMLAGALLVLAEFVGVVEEIV